MLIYTHEIRILITYVQKPHFNSHADASSRDIRSNTDKSLHLNPYCMGVSSEGSGA